MLKKNIPDRMMAIVKNRKEPGLDYHEVAVPRPGPDDVLVDVRATAICGSDLNCYVWNKWAQKLHTNLPFVPGHEFSGVVVETGNNVQGIKSGDRVAGETHIPCGRCYHCRNDLQHICQNLEFFGHTVDGCFSNYCVIPGKSTRVVRADLSWETMALLEPFGVAARVVEETGVFGECVVILGCGAIGQFLIAASAFGGAERIIAVDPIEGRRALAESMGAAETLDPGMDIPAEVLRRTDGDGAGVIIEASGNRRAFESCFRYLRKGGKVSVVGLPKEPVSLDIIQDVIFKEVKLTGFHGRRMYTSWETAENLLASGKIDLGPAVTHRMKMVDFEKAFEMALSGEACKVILLPPS